MPESGCKTQRSGAEEHRAIVSLSPGGFGYLTTQCLCAKVGWRAKIASAPRKKLG